VVQKGLTVHVVGCREALMNYVRMWLFLGMSVITSVCMFTATSDHSHSPVLPADVDRVGHQEGRRDSRLAGVHLVYLSAD